MAEVDEVRAAAAAVVGGEFDCPDCERSFPSRASLAQHRRNAHSPAPRTRAAAKPAEPAPADLVVEVVVGKTVANLQVLGGYLSIVLPHTGLAIAGVPHPDSVPDERGRVRNPEAPPIVQSRALLAGRVLDQWARKDPRVLAAMNRFNQIFEISEVLELAAGVGAAVAVDVGAIPADLAIEVGPFAGANAIRPVHAVIGDVVDYVAEMRAQAEGAQLRDAPNGRAPDGAEVVEGGVEDT